MSLMEWSDELDIKVNDMNDQHKGLLDIMNQLFDQFNQGANFLILNALLTQLAQKTIEHFREEEIFMESIGYTGLDSHKQIHQKLLETLDEHIEAFNQSRELNRQFFDFLRLWLRSHIMGIDTKYAEVAQKQAA